MQEPEEYDCTTPDCPGEVAAKRWELGYKTCLKCGSPRQQFFIMEMPKSNSIVTSRVENTRGLAASHKSPRVAW